MKRRGWFLALLAVPLMATAQTAPRADEVARFGPLHAAAQRGDPAALKRALDDGAEVDSRDGHGRTALHVATFARQREVIRVLAERKASLRQPDLRDFAKPPIAGRGEDWCAGIGFRSR